MSTGQLILLLLLILVAVVVVALVLRMSGAKRAERQRVEAAGLRSEADAMAATMSGQTAFAQQAEERADLARAEAAAKDREAAELEAEAAQGRATADATRRDYESTMRRADDVDPDVTQSSFAPVGDQSADAGAEGTADAVRDLSGDVDDLPATDVATKGEPEDLPMTRAERRLAREEAESGIGQGEPAAESEPEPEPEVVATGASAAASAWSSPVAGPDPDSERIASAADYRDEVIAGGSAHEVYPSPASGSGMGMSNSAGTTTTDLASLDDALSQDVEIPTNEWGGPREDAAAPVLAHDQAATVVDEGAAEADGAASETSPDLGAQATEEEFVVEQPAEERAGRRISGFLELRDGGFGVGSAAPMPDGAQPLDHPVQAYRDTMTFRAPGDPGYDSVEPDVWFYDAGAAERSGFRHADG